jgi:hypothetical protein
MTYTNQQYYSWYSFMNSNIFFFLQLVQQSVECGRSQGLWQLKLCLAYQQSPFRLQPPRTSPSPPPPVLEPTFLRCLSSYIDDRLETWQAGEFMSFNSVQ